MVGDLDGVSHDALRNSGERLVALKAEVVLVLHGPDVYLAVHRPGEATLIGGREVRGIALADHRAEVRGPGPHGLGRTAIVAQGLQNIVGAEDDRVADDLIAGRQAVETLRAAEHVVAQGWHIGWEAI